ncbi:hypothetical protein ABFS82_09G099900 [Erythranthe guttata]
MASKAGVSDSVDPLGGINGPSLFPRTIRASADVPVPADSKDLDSIHNFMKSLELRSPEKLMCEAKKIVDGGIQLMESNFASFAENVGIGDAIAAKGKDRPQERRPGLARVRKRAPFSLKTNISQPSVILEPTLNIDHLQDPDEYFDAYERMQNAKKEIQKQLGGSTDNLDLYKPSNNARPRRPGILGKSYNYKHRFSSTPYENDDTSMPSQETVDEDIPNSPKDESQEKLVHPDPSPDAGSEEVEAAESTKKTDNEVNNILEELLSCNYEDLEGHGALNILQDRLKIKPLDRENLYMTELADVGRTSISIVSESLQKPRKNSSVIDSVLKSFSRKRSIEHEPVANPNNHVSSPTPPRSPFASMAFLKKRILQSNPLRDPFSPLDVDLSAFPNASPALTKDKRQDDAPKDSGMSSELESRVEVEYAEPATSNVNAQEAKENTQGMGMSSELQSHVEADYAEPTTSNAQKATENAQDDFENEVMAEAHNLSEQFADGNASTDAGSRPNEESDNNTEKIMNVNENESNHAVLEEEARDATSNRQQKDPEQQPKVHQKKLQRGKRVLGEECNLQRGKGVVDEERKLQRGKRVLGEERIKKAHPMRKSLAECGTSFDTGVRRSKRIKMRPLEYWKGERFLFGRVDDSMKLIGVKYISPGKSDNDNMKVKPYILSESPDYKELLELAARH